MKNFCTKTLFLIPAMFSVMLSMTFAVISQKAHAQGASQDGVKAKIFAEAFLVSNSIENGITQTDRSLALQTQFGSQWEQFRLGLWGSNVKYLTVDDSLNLRLFAAYKFIINRNVNLEVKYSLNRYFKVGSRDGNRILVDLDLFSYHVIYETIDNFEATTYSDIRYGFGKEWKFYWGSTVDINAFYNNVADSGYTNYFNLTSSLKLKWQEIQWALTVSGVSKASQFNGRAGTDLVGSMGVQF